MSLSNKKKKQTDEADLRKEVLNRRFQWQVNHLLVINTNHCRTELDTV